jgi:hypothetical protein
MIPEQVGNDCPVTPPGERHFFEYFRNPEIRGQRLCKRRLPGTPGKHERSIDIE